MDVLIIIFIAMALLIGLFSVALVFRDFVLDERQRRRKAADQQPQPQVPTVICPVAMAQPVAEPAPVAEPVAEPAAEPVAEPQPEPVATRAEPTIDLDDESTVAFSAVSQSLDEKYLELEPEFKGYYDEIVRCAMSVSGSKRFKNASYEEYKVGSNRLVRIKIKRGIVICELVIPNLAFKSYINSNKVAMKQAPATIKVTDEQSLNAVKHSMGIAMQAIEEERAYKKEQAKLRRKQAKKSADVADTNDQQ